MISEADAIDNDPTGTQPAWILQPYNPLKSDTRQFVTIVAEQGEIVALTFRGKYYGIVNDEVPMDDVVAYGWPYGMPVSTFINSHKFEADKMEVKEHPLATTGKYVDEKAYHDISLVIVQVVKFDLSAITTTRNPDGSISQSGVTGKEKMTTTLNNPHIPPTFEFDWTWVVVGGMLIGGGLIAYFLYRHYGGGKSG